MADKGSIIFDRVGHVELLVGSNMKKFDGLDFKFSISKIFEGGVQNNAKVGLLGLNRAHIQYLSTFLDQGTNLATMKRIKVYAGYANGGEQLIFDGDIMHARPTIPPNNWLNIEALMRGRRHTKIVSMAINGRIKYIDLIRSLASYLGLSLWIRTGNTREMNRVINGFDCSGSKADLISRINSIGDLVCCELESGTLMVGDRDVTQISNSAVHVIDYESGLVGIPKFGWPTIQFTMFIDTQIRIWDTVRLHSEFVPGADGNYIVRSIKYNGQLRDGGWYMDIEAMSTNTPRKYIRGT